MGRSMARVALTVSPQKVQFRPPETKRFGLIILATDLTSERDFYRQTHEQDAAFHVARVAFENPTTPENLRQMAPRLIDAAGLLAPIAPLNAVCYSCTSASVVIGDAEVRRSIQTQLPGVPVVTPAAAAVKSLEVLAVSRIAILTPYTIETSRPMAAYFSDAGFDIVKFDCLGIEDDRDMARVGQETLVNAAIAADHPDAEALFISCTALPVLDVINEIEARIGKPVVTSNQAACWLMTRLGGLTGHRPGNFGKLYSLDLSFETSCNNR